MTLKEDLNKYKLGNEITKINNGTSEIMAKILGVDLSERKYDFMDVLFYLDKKDKEFEQLKEELSAWKEGRVVIEKLE